MNPDAGQVEGTGDVRPGFDVAALLERGELAAWGADPRCDADFFEARIGQRFQFEQAVREAELELVEVHRYRPNDVEPESGIRLQPFALLFKGRHDQPLGNGLHVVTHPDLGRGALFLTPVLVSMRRPQPSDDLHYEALFN